MTIPDVYVAGKKLDLVKRIGRGGEGDVYLFVGNEHLAVKIYREDKRKDREEKVAAIIKQGLAEKTTLIAFPRTIVTSKTGDFVGFTMRLVNQFRPIHELYGPKSRKMYYPKADYRFLIRAATNIARAIGEVHNSSCVVGDLNHSGILVSGDATVALIDADSFQITVEGRTFPCLVGVPEFTPPELQASSLGSILRTEEHDHFGLAVTIFQLLFMGRHPYAGKQSSGNDLTLDQLIARNLFAYSRTRKTGSSPPNIMATLDDFPSDIGEAFERSFGLSPSHRPSALDWISLLKNLEGRLNRCATDRVHFYPSAAKSCPWCRMEQASGALLFISPILLTTELINFDVEKIWGFINAVVLPDPATIIPRLSFFSAEPNLGLHLEKNRRKEHKTFSIKIACGAILLLLIGHKFFLPSLIGIGLLCFAVYKFTSNSVNTVEWNTRYNKIEQSWQEELKYWRKSIGIDSLISLKSNLNNSINEYRGLATEKFKAITRFKSERHQRQLYEYLDRLMICNASISGIGQVKTARLAIYGIETAADISESAIMNISGFGQATADTLLAWRVMHQRRFIYNPAPLPADKQAQAKIEAEFSAKASKLAKHLSGGQAELVYAANQLSAKLNQESPELIELAKQKAQIVADMKFLGLKLP
jgi:DNA-binding helix-hairpin-helix protein with protein kinase domain